MRILLVVLALSASCAASLAHADGRWCITRDTVLFGNRAVGSSTTENVTVSNCGDAPWSFTDVSVHPATGPAWHVSTTCATGLSLAPAQSCSASIQFAPLADGQTSGGLWLRNTTNTPTQLVTFYGRGVDAASGTATLVFSPSSAIFPVQAIGKQSDNMTIELRNLGPAALTPSAVVLNGPEVYDFSGDLGTCAVGKAIPAGQSCALTLYFVPQDAGTRRANLVIDSPQLASLAIMQISGTGAGVSGTGVPPAPSGAVAIPSVGPAGLVLLAFGLLAFGATSLRRRKGADYAPPNGRS